MIFSYDMMIDNVKARFSEKTTKFEKSKFYSMLPAQLIKNILSKYLVLVSCINLYVSSTNFVISKMHALIKFQAINF
jgi:hypothetical protein